MALEEKEVLQVTMVRGGGKKEIMLGIGGG